MAGTSCHSAQCGSLNLLTHRLRSTVSAAAFFLCAAQIAAAAVPVEVTLRGAFALPTTAADQNGTSFSVTGLSGITSQTATEQTRVLAASRISAGGQVQLRSGADMSLTAVQIKEVRE